MSSTIDLASRALAQFDVLVELEDAERATRLAELRRTDPALADEVARMLRADARASGVIDQGLPAMAPTIAEPAGIAHGATNEGRRVGPFVLRRLLGRGGMGEVWLAQRIEGDFRQDVALKLVRRGMDSEELQRRFVRERRILAELSHPGIARFIDGGVGDDGAPWYAMEHVEGVPLTEFARASALNVRERVALLAQVAETVAYAQTRLVVHRDLKPSNILVDAQRRVRLLDFGIAKLLDDDGDAEQTATGVRAMSPAYAAPEQILDEAISTATDVYSLGVVLYELLTGALPHQRTGLGLEKLAERVRQETTERPSVRLRSGDPAATTTLGTPSGTLQRFAREVAGELDTIVLTALRREPERRYAHAEALADDLRRWLDGRPVAAQPDTATYRARKFVARHRLAVGSASAVLLALIAGFGTALWQASVAREQARRAQVQLARAEAIREFTQSLFREQDPMSRATAAARTPRELVTIGIERAQRQFAEDDVLRWELLSDLADIQLVLGDSAAALPLVESLLQARRESHGEGSAEFALEQSKYSSALFAQGKIDPALEQARAAAATLAAVRGPDDPESLRAASRLLNAEALTAKKEDVLARAEDLVQRYTKVFGPDANETLVALVDLTTQQEAFDELDAAGRTLAVLIARIEGTLGPEHLMLARPLARAGDVHRRMERYDQAEPLFARAEAIARKHEAKQVLGGVLLRKGDLLRRMGRLDEAERAFADALSVVPAGSGEAAQVEQLLGGLARARGDHAAAAEHFLRSKVDFERAIGKPTTYSWSSALHHASSMIQVGRAAEVEQLLEEARAGLHELAPAPSEEAFLVATAFGELHAALGRPQESERSYREAIAVGTEVYDAAHVPVLRVRIALAKVLAPGRPAAARKELEGVLGAAGGNDAVATEARELLDGIRE
jgi:serine/threonine-protein kinase